MVTLKRLLPLQETGETKMKSFLSQKVWLAFGFAMLALLLMGLFSYRWMVVSDESDSQVRHTHEVLANIQDLALAMESIESATRGFVLTGKESDLDAYRANVSRVTQDLATIRGLTVDNPAQQIHFPALEVLAAGRIQRADMVINLRRTQGFAAAVAAIDSGPDEQDAEFQSLVGKLQNEEARLLAVRNAATEHDLNQAKTILLFGTLLGMLIVAAAVWTAAYSSSTREVAEARYRGLMEAAPDGMVVVNQSGEIVLLNAQAETQFGYRRDELLGQKVTNIIPEGFAERLIADETRTAAEALAQQIGTGIELNGLRKDGSSFPIEIMLSPLESAEGILVTAAIRDITVRKDAEENLAQMEARYRGLMEAAPDGMVVVNQSGGIVLLNAQAEKQFGYRRDELLGQKVKNIIPEGFAERLIADGTRTAAEALAQQIGTGIELNGLRKDGSEFPIEIMLSPLESAEGILVTAAIRDITLRKDAEKHLAQMEARYRGLMEAAPDGMVVVNQSGEIVLLNVQAEKQFGYRRDELLGQNVTNIIPEGFAERLIADALRTTAEALAQQIGTGIELNGRRKDGSSFPIEIMLSPLESAEGILVTAAIRDISERKQLARQLYQSQKMEAVGQLTGGIAHDFNNLLGVIIGNLDLLERLVTGNEAAIKRVQTAQKAATRGADITRRLLVFSTNEELKPSVVLLGDSVQNTIELAARALGAEIKIITHVNKPVPSLFVDPAGLESALLNLVMNARDAMPEGGSIIIASQVRNIDDSHPAVHAGDLKAGRYVCVSITDTGSGMSRETLERAFEPFFTTKPRNKGTGLGLAMVYGFVKRSGGAVRVYSELGQGTTVSLYLPFVEDLSQPLPADAPQPLDAKLGGTVLVVDDEGDLLEVALAYLTEMGFTALDAKDGASALEVIAQHGEIDLMITDIVMPGGMNGVELVQRALALHPNLRIIYSSGFPAEALAERSMPLVDGPLLRKPYQRSEFAAIVDHVMKSNYAKPQGTLPFDRLFADGSTGS
jgi:PAS domain S-box-containing protein